MKKMIKKPVKKFVVKKRWPVFWITIAVVFTFFFLGLIVVVHKLTTFRARLVVETPLTEMHRIPADVKKQMRKQALASPSASLRVPILTYHYVEYVKDGRDTIRQGLNVNPNIFEKQLKTLVDSNFTFMTAKELGEVLDGDMDLPLKPVLLTFDDGHWDLETDVLPLLIKYHVKATAYIVPGLLGGSDYLTIDQLKRVAESGLVEIADHTVHHLALKGRPEKSVKYEVEESKKMLEELLKIKIWSFAYPYGSFDQQAADIVKGAGFTNAVSTIAGNEQSEINRFFLYRLRPGSLTGQALLNYLQEKRRQPIK
jgi:peptidoglycan/xylan/chitin deacetylase (PgdA/CDA1 family)